jgi:uncharacterized protein (DUF58 family)
MPGVRPTARGWQALLIGLAVLATARLFGTTQLHQLAYVFLALLLAALVLGVWGSQGLRFLRRMPAGARLTAGESSRMELLISNGSRLGIPGAQVMDRVPSERSFETPPLGSGYRATVEVPLKFSRRGVYQLGPAEVRTRDPFGLLRFSRAFDDRMEVLVYPRVHDLSGFPLGGGTVESGAKSTSRGRGDEFAGLKEYNRGDDPRHIHWKSVARTGQLYVRQFSLQDPQRYTIALDLTRRGLRVPEGEVEDAVSAAASALALLRREHMPLRLLCTDKAGSRTEFSTREQPYWEAMRLLALARADGDEEIGGLLSRERASLGEGVIVISRDRDGELADGVRRLREASLTVIVVAIATHTYVAGPVGGRRESERAAGFSRGVARLEDAGAEVLVVRHPEGVAGLSGSIRKERSPA